MDSQVTYCWLGSLLHCGICLVDPGTLSGGVHIGCLESFTIGGEDMNDRGLERCVSQVVTQWLPRHEILLRSIVNAIFV